MKPTSLPRLRSRLWMMNTYVLLSCILHSNLLLEYTNKCVWWSGGLGRFVVLSQSCVISTSTFLLWFSDIRRPTETRWRLCYNGQADVDINDNIKFEWRKLTNVSGIIQIAIYSSSSKQYWNSSITLCNSNNSNTKNTLKPRRRCEIYYIALNGRKSDYFPTIHYEWPSS